MEAEREWLDERAVIGRDIVLEVAVRRAVLAHSDMSGQQEVSMGYDDLIAVVRSLPEDRQREVFDFVEFLASRAAVPSVEASGRAQSTIADLIANPIRLDEPFVPLTREQANAR